MTKLISDEKLFLHAFIVTSVELRNLLLVQKFFKNFWSKAFYEVHKNPFIVKLSMKEKILNFTSLINQY